MFVTHPSEKEYLWSPSLMKLKHARPLKSPRCMASPSVASSAGSNMACLHTRPLLSRSQTCWTASGSRGFPPKASGSSRTGVRRPLHRFANPWATQKAKLGKHPGHETRSVRRIDGHQRVSEPGTLLDQSEL